MKQELDTPPLVELEAHDFGRGRISPFTRPRSKKIRDLKRSMKRYFHAHLGKTNAFHLLSIKGQMVPIARECIGLQMYMRLPEEKNR